MWKRNQTMNTTQTITIAGMTCGNCVAKVQKRLAEHPDIATATVTLEPPGAELQLRRPLAIDELGKWLASLGQYRVSESSARPLPTPSATTYKPLLLLLGYLLLVSASGLMAKGGWDTMLAMQLFMGGFFIAFSFFKFLDLRGFADAYRSYDLIAKAWPPYGFIYPFIELGLGLAFISHANPQIVNLITAIVMAVSLAGVLRAVLSKQSIRCACLGTVFQLPMSTVTIIEDGLMLGMAIAMLIIF